MLIVSEAHSASRTLGGNRGRAGSVYHLQTRGVGAFDPCVCQTSQGQQHQRPPAPHCSPPRESVFSELRSESETCWESGPSQEHP